MDDLLLFISIFSTPLYSRMYDWIQLLVVFDSDDKAQIKEACEGYYQRLLTVYGPSSPRVVLAKRWTNRPPSRRELAEL